MRHHRAVQFEFGIFRAGALKVCVKIDAIGDFWHQSFGKAHCPLAVVVLDHGAVSVSAGVCGIVPGAIIIHGPI